MVIFIIDVDGIFIRPAESDSIVSGHPNRPAGRVTAQRMKARSGEVHLVRFRRVIQNLQDTYALPGMCGTNSMCPTSYEEFFESLVTEADNHCFQCMCTARLLSTV